MTPRRAQEHEARVAAPGEGADFVAASANVVAGTVVEHRPSVSVRKPRAEAAPFGEWLARTLRRLGDLG
jgi:hypothetical protein